MNNNSKRKKYNGSFFSDFVIPVVVAVILAYLINRFVIYKIYIPSGSMYPTLQIGDQCFATKIFNKEKIQRGDILVFYSNELQERLIKRVVGLPGETVELRSDGQVYIDGAKLEEDYVKNQSGPARAFKLPEDHYLFLGDNRADSKDARFWDEKYINREDIEGKALIRIFPLKRFGVIK
ncbi:MAG: signal peptidase I [Clostridia bacterium]|nr:signal peptidase I [Clostridia bacterium]